MDDSRVMLEDLTPVRKRLQIEIPAGAVEAELERAFRRLGQQARLPGFRPGKAPRHVLERMFGVQVRREVLERLVGESFHHAVETHQLAVVGAPDIDAETLTPGEALRYSATVDVRPTIALGDLGSIEVVRPSASVGEEEVDRVIGALRESVAHLHPVEDRSIVEAGDVVTVELTSRLDGGEPVHREAVLLEAGGGTFPLALENQLVGQRCGAPLSLRVPYPAEHANPRLAGKMAEFEVEIKELRVKELPPLDDDFARDHGRGSSLADLRAKVRADLERDAVARADEAVGEAVMEQLIARHRFEVPSSLVDRRTDALLASLDVRLPPEGEQEQVLDQLRQKLRPRAEGQVRAELLLDALAARDGIVVSEADVTTELAAMTARERQLGDRRRAPADRPELRAALRAKLVRDRALSRVVANAKVMPAPAAESVAREK